MNGFLIRLRLILKLWFTSVYSICVMLLIPIVAFVIYSQGSYTVEDLLSIVYEEAAPIWFVLILQWCLSIDFDSKFHMQVMTYPIARWKFLLERLLFSAVIFIGLLSVVTIKFDTLHGNFCLARFSFYNPNLYRNCGICSCRDSVLAIIQLVVYWQEFYFG